MTPGVDRFSDAQVQKLRQNLDPKYVKTRKQSNVTLSYVEAWHAIDEANRIFGHDNWTREILRLEMVSEVADKIGKGERDGWKVSYIATVRILACGVMRDGTGSGHGIDVDCGKAHESAVKEAESDAMKRALMTFGYPFGLALYDKNRAHVGPPTNATTWAGRVKTGLFNAEKGCGLDKNDIDTVDAVIQWVTGGGYRSFADATRTDSDAQTVYEAMKERYHECGESFDQWVNAALGRKQADELDESFRETVGTE